MFAGVDSVVAHRIDLAQLRGSRIVTEQALIVRRHDTNGLRPVIRYRNRLGVLIKRIGAQRLAQAQVQQFLVGTTERGVGGAVFALRPDLKQRLRLTMQPVRTPVRRNQRAVPPD